MNGRIFSHAAYVEGAKSGACSSTGYPFTECTANNDAAKSDAYSSTAKSFIRCTHSFTHNRRPL